MEPQDEDLFDQDVNQLQFNQELANVDINKEIITAAEKRSKILKILREYVEEPDSIDRTAETRKAVFGTLDIFKTVSLPSLPERAGPPAARSPAQTKRINKYMGTI